MFECTEIKDNKTGLIYSIKHIRISDTFNYSADTRYFIGLVPTARLEINPERPTEPKERIYIDVIPFGKSNYVEISTMANTLKMLLENYALQNYSNADISDILFFVADNLKRINDFCDSENILVGCVEKEFIYKNKSN